MTVQCPRFQYICSHYCQSIVDYSNGYKLMRDVRVPEVEWLFNAVVGTVVTGFICITVSLCSFDIYKRQLVSN